MKTFGYFYTLSPRWIGSCYCGLTTHKKRFHVVLVCSLGTILIIGTCIQHVGFLVALIGSFYTKW